MSDSRTWPRSQRPASDNGMAATDRPVPETHLPLATRRSDEDRSGGYFACPASAGSAERNRRGCVRPRRTAAGNGWCPARPGRTRPAARRRIPAGRSPRERLPREPPRPGFGPGSGTEREVPGARGRRPSCSAHGIFPRLGKFPAFPGSSPSAQLSPRVPLNFSLPAALSVPAPSPDHEPGEESYPFAGMTRLSRSSG
jgi:hypothetical protein